jgi:hypothetical protein
MGRTARFEQIYVANLDSEPIEQETLTGVKSILTKEIEANEVLLKSSDGIRGRLGIANTVPTKNFSLGTKLFMDVNDTIVFDLKDRGRASRFYVENQLAVGTTNPTKAFQVNDGATRKVDIDLTGRDLMTVSGNLAATNVIITNNLIGPGSNIIINDSAANVVTVVGNLVSTNILVTSNLDVGSNVRFSDEGANVAYITGDVTQIGDLYLEGNVRITGNISVSDIAKYTSYEPSVTEDPVILLGNGNNGTVETGIILAPGDSPTANIGFGYKDDTRFGDDTKEMGLFYTSDFVESFTGFTVDTTKTVNLHVYGDTYVDKKLGVSNTNPTSNLCIGDKFRVSTPPGVVLPGESSNILEVDGYTYTKGLKIGPLGLQVGNAVTVNPLGLADPTASVISIAGNIQAKGLRTTGADGWLSGIANTIPKDTLNIGTPAVVTCNIYDGNTWYVYGNTYSSNVLADFARITGDMRIGGPGVTTDNGTYNIKSSGELVIHANDSSATNDTSNSLILKSGTPVESASIIELSAASETPANQFIRFKTKNTERMRLTSDGKFGFNNTAPSDTVTVSGPVKINFANTLTLGNIFGTAQQTSMQMRVRPDTNADAFLEAHVGSGKGMKFGVTSTGTMGGPKMVISDNGGVGIGVTTPHGRLNTSGATVYINRQVGTSSNNNYDHTLTPLVVTNQNGISGVDDPQSTMILAREAASGYGAKALFALDRWEAGASRTRMDIKLAHGAYDDVDIMSVRSDGRVGIGKTDPTAPLEVKSSGVGNPSGNGLVVYNPSASEAQDSIITVKTGANKSDAFVSFTDDANQGWSAGMTDRVGDRDFRITNNVFAVSNVLHTALFIDGVSSNVGIGTDVTVARFTVDGDVRIGNELSFAGVANDEGDLRHHTFMLEQLYEDESSELFIFKGNDGVSRAAGAGPDRIRHVAAEHRFQVYDNTGALDQDDVDNIISDTAVSGIFNTRPVLMVSGTERVLVATESEDGLNTTDKLYVNGGIRIPKEQSFITGGMELKSSDADTNNIINSLSDNRDFVFQINDVEKMRFKNTGALGIGTDSPSSNLHVYAGQTTNKDVAIIESAAAASGTSKTGLVIHKGSGYGGYIHGYKNVTASTAGLIFGGEYNNSETNAITILKSSSHSNVGIGTTVPSAGFHVYNKNPKIENTTSNAIVDLVTTAGTSNIYASNTGNVHIVPKHTHVKIDGNLDISGDIKFDGELELGNEIGINLAGASPETNLHVKGGVITNSDYVSRKLYSYSYSITDFSDLDLVLTFGAGAFYAKIVAMLRRIDGSTTKDVSTMLLEVQGGSSDEDTPSTLDIAIGTKNLFGGTNSYPWSPTVSTGRRSIRLVPYNTDGTRQYAYDISVELMSSCGGKLVSLTRDSNTTTDLDTGTGGGVSIKTFNY